jgi:hypothetical protein
MKILRILVLVLVAVVAVVAIAAPIGPLPGLFIGGTPTLAPANWPDTSGVHEIRLKVPGTLPRVVIIWVVDHGGELHVVGRKGSGWVRMIGNGAPVEMRIDDHTYALRAEPVTEGWEAVLQAYVDKYRPDYPDIVAGLPTLEEARGTVAVFRLTRG